MDRIWRQIRGKSPEDRAGLYPAPSPSSGEPVETPAPGQDGPSTIDKIKALPAPIGVLLVGAGVAGLALPGPMGTPLILAGGLVLAPKTFGKVEQFLEQRFPDLHQAGLEAVERFIEDLEKRFPSQRG